MRIGIATDHGGFELKVQLTVTLKAVANATRLRIGSRQNEMSGSMNPIIDGIKFYVTIP